MKVAVMTCVVGLHVVVIAMFMLAQGCGATRPPQVTPPAEPVMPPRTTEAPPVEPVRPPLLPPEEPRRTPPSLPDFGTYTVRRGDTLSGIAQRLGVSWRELAAVNALEEPYRIVEGQPLLVPGYTGEIEPPARTEPRTEARSPTPAPEDGYVVQPGDSLTGIGQKLGVKWRELAELNSLTPPYRIRAGQTLRVPDGARRAVEETPRPRSQARDAVPSPARADPAPGAYVTPEAPPVEQPQQDQPRLGDDQPFPYPVGEGETLASIAQFFMVSEDALRRLNDLPAPQEVRSGQRILIPPLPRD